MVSATWINLIASDKLQRSSHVLSVVSKHAHLFGGELLPRQPRDNHVYRLDLKSHGMSDVALLYNAHEHGLTACCISSPFHSGNKGHVCFTIPSRWDRFCHS